METCQMYMVEAVGIMLFEVRIYKNTDFLYIYYEIMSL